MSWDSATSLVYAPFYQFNENRSTLTRLSAIIKINFTATLCFTALSKRIKLFIHAWSDVLDSWTVSLSDGN